MEGIQPLAQRNERSFDPLFIAGNYGGSSRQTKYASIHIQNSEIPSTRAKGERRKETTTWIAGIGQSGVMSAFGPMPASQSRPIGCHLERRCYLREWRLFADK
jgi:hypothetical protein